MAAELTVALLTRGDPRQCAHSIATVLNQTWHGQKLLKIACNREDKATRRLVDGLVTPSNSVEWLHDVPGGTAQARNRILRSTETKYLAWIDAGDLWHPRKLELQFRALETSVERPTIVACRTYSRAGDAAAGTPKEGSSDASTVPEIAFVPFSALLGETRAFEAIGELDERLALLADEEYLLRLGLTETISTRFPAAPALCSVSPSPAKQPPQLAREADMLLAHHARELSYRLGRKGARAYRRQLIGHGRASAGGKPAAGWQPGASAGRSLVLPLTSRRAEHARLRETLRAPRLRAAQLAKRAGIRILAADALNPSHPAVVTFVDVLLRSGWRTLSSVAPGLAGMAARNDTAQPPKETRLELSPADLSVWIISYACCAAGKLDRAEALLTARLNRTPLSETPPPLIERLAAVHLALGRREQAQTFLETALLSHPNDAALQLSLVDALVQSGKWTQATKQWEGASPEAKAIASPSQRARLARAYRLLGQPEEALAFASYAAITEQGDELSIQLDKCRRLSANWPGCLVPVERRSLSAPGRVDSWGFLAGNRDSLTGHLRLTAETTAKICLRVNGMPIATTWAAAADASATGVFSINCADLLYYLGDGDTIEVTDGRRRLALPDGATTVMVHNGLRSRVGELRNKLDRGHVFTKLGSLVASRSNESKREVLDFYSEVAELLEAKLGAHLFPFYGNLLGAVREHDFIEHDADGFDVLVLCQGRTPAEVKTELRAVCAVLRDHGFALEAKPWCIYVRRQPRTGPLLDLNYGWFTDSDEFQVAFGWRYPPTRGREAMLTERHCRLADRDVKIPGNAEAVLEQLYGPTWHALDQGHSTTGGLQRDERYLLSSSEMADLLDASSTTGYRGYAASQ